MYDVFVGRVSGVLSFTIIERHKRKDPRWLVCEGISGRVCKLMTEG
jgi:hypothetical protein